MKLFMLIGLILFSQVTLANSKGSYIVLHSEMKLDLKNLFADGKKVDYRKFNIPEEIARTYTVKISYIFQKNLISKSLPEFIPAQRNCSLRECREFPAQYYIKLNYSNSDIGILYELFDDGTGKLVSSSFAPITLQFIRRQTYPVMEFTGPETGYMIGDTKGVLSVYDQAQIEVDVYKARIADTNFEVEKLKLDDNSNRKSYRLNKVYFRGSYVEKTIPRTVYLNYKKKEIRFGFLVGAPASEYGSSPEKFIDLIEE